MSATAAIHESLRGYFPKRAQFPPTMLLDRDYNWCADTMLKHYGMGAAIRAEHRVREMQQDGNRGGRDIWTRVAAIIRQIQANVQAA